LLMRWIAVLFVLLLPKFQSLHPPESIR